MLGVGYTVLKAKTLHFGHIVYLSVLYDNKINSDYAWKWY
jgi:hypothetical protein